MGRRCYNNPDNLQYLLDNNGNSSSIPPWTRGCESIETAWSLTALQETLLLFRTKFSFTHNLLNIKAYNVGKYDVSIPSSLNLTMSLPNNIWLPATQILCSFKNQTAIDKLNFIYLVDVKETECLAVYATINGRYKNRWKYCRPLTSGSTSIQTSQQKQYMCY